MHLIGCGREWSDVLFQCGVFDAVREAALRTPSAGDIIHSTLALFCHVNPSAKISILGKLALSDVCHSVLVDCGPLKKAGDSFVTEADLDAVALDHRRSMFFASLESFMQTAGASASLSQMMERLEAEKAALSEEESYSTLAQAVADTFGGPVSDSQAKLAGDSGQLVRAQRHRGSSAVTFDELGGRSSYARATMFKLACDRLGLPCSLEKTTAPRTALNRVPIDGCMCTVNMMSHPGELTRRALGADPTVWSPPVRPPPIHQPNRVNNERRTPNRSMSRVPSEEEGGSRSSNLRPPPAASGRQSGKSHHRPSKSSTPRARKSSPEKRIP